jgi:hypothetical protein
MDDFINAPVTFRFGPCEASAQEHRHPAPALRVADVKIAKM